MTNILRALTTPGTRFKVVYDAHLILNPNDPMELNLRRFTFEDYDPYASYDGTFGEVIAVGVLDTTIIHMVADLYTDETYIHKICHAPFQFDLSDWEEVDDECYIILSARDLYRFR